MQLLSDTLSDMVAIKIWHAQKYPNLSPVEIARVTSTLLYNLDAWDGYPTERERLYSILSDKKVVDLPNIHITHGWENLCMREEIL